jgi:flagellar biosynthetic protein FliO
VAAYKKKIVAFLVAVVLVSPSVCLGQTAGFVNDPNFFLSSANSPGAREMFFKMMLSVLLVIALGAAVIYISKKFLPRITNLPGKKIRVIETAHIGPRKMVHLLKIGNQQLLIGSTSENITKLADVTDALSETEAGCEGSRPLPLQGQARPRGSGDFENRDVFNSEMDLSVTETDNN